LAKAQRYLGSSELLLRDGDVDSAVSRAYYAVLHAAKAMLMIHGHPEVEDWKTHPQVLNTCARENRRYTWFQDVRPLTGERDLQRSLFVLHALRDDADYEVDKITPAGAREALRFARDFIRCVERKIHEREGQTRT
jgi:uncharacterized protein (UPF0332 family)